MSEQINSETTEAPRFHISNINPLLSESLMDTACRIDAFLTMLSEIEPDGDFGGSEEFSWGLTLAFDTMRNALRMHIDYGAKLDFDLTPIPHIWDMPREAPAEEQAPAVSEPEIIDSLEQVFSSLRSHHAKRDEPPAKVLGVLDRALAAIAETKGAPA